MKKPGKMVGEVLRAAFQKPATHGYPFVKFPIPDKFRGKLHFDAAKCVGCLACVRDCPALAIKIVKVGDKRFKAEIDLDKCVYCAQCVDSCFKKALVATPEYELAQIKRATLKVVFDAPPPPAEAPAASAEPAKKSE